MLERAESFGATVVRLKKQSPDRAERKRFGRRGRAACVCGCEDELCYCGGSAECAQAAADSAVGRLAVSPGAGGVPAHCQYCYLAGSLSGPPIYARVRECAADSGEPAGVCGRGERLRPKSADRAHEGTTFEASCYTDPLGIEHLTGSLAESIRFFWRVGCASAAAVDDEVCGGGWAGGH